MKAQTTTYNWNVQETVGKAIEKAGENTAVGLVNVMLILVLLTLVIGLFRFIPSGSRKKKELEAAEAAAPVVLETAQEPEEEGADDGEIAAVIAAAVAAYESENGKAPADGFVVRSSITIYNHSIGEIEMKNYTITVNGNVYDVTVEENGASAAAPAAPKAAPAAAPKAAAPKAAAPKAATAGAGSVKVNASVPGKVTKVNASVGQSVKPGDAIVTLEAMKMEIPVVAPQAGTVASIEVGVGDAVENGQLLATMN